MCTFNEAWIGTCKEAGEPFCEKHTQLTCASCGEQASRTCAQTGQFVCGAPLCEKCEHTIAENGTNGGIGFNSQMPPEGMKAHCRKVDQIHKPWYEREDSFKNLEKENID